MEEASLETQRQIDDLLGRFKYARIEPPKARKMAKYFFNLANLVDAMVDKPVPRMHCLNVLVSAREHALGGIDVEEN